MTIRRNVYDMYNQDNTWKPSEYETACQVQQCVWGLKIVWFVTLSVFMLLSAEVFGSRGVSPYILILQWCTVFFCRLVFPRIPLVSAEDLPKLRMSFGNCRPCPWCWKHWHRGENISYRSTGRSGRGWEDVGGGVGERSIRIVAGRLSRQIDRTQNVILQDMQKDPSKLFLSILYPQEGCKARNG